MKVARETIILALEDMIGFEEMATNNLTEVGHYDFSCFGHEGQGQIRELMTQLREDADAHRFLIRTIIEKLKGRR